MPESCEYIGVVCEFGTYTPPFVFAKLRAEMALTNANGPEAREEPERLQVSISRRTRWTGVRVGSSLHARPQVKSAFYPQTDDGWKTRVLSEGRAVFYAFARGLGFALAK
jgi:hypothetical protein